MNILGIDYSLNGTGLSIFKDKKILFKKVFTLAPKVYDENPDVFILIPKFGTTEEKIDWVCNHIINCTDYDMVCMEDHIGSYYNWMDGYAILKHYLRKNNKPYLCIAPSQLKKYAGTGKADKTQMAYFLRKEYKLDFDFLGNSANNLVDATWLSIVGNAFYDKIIKHKKIKINEDRNLILQNLNLYGGVD